MPCLALMCQLKLLRKNTHTASRIKYGYSMYMYDGKLDMHIPSHFDPPVNTKLFSA